MPSGIYLHKPYSKEARNLLSINKKKLYTEGKLNLDSFLRGGAKANLGKTWEEIFGKEKAKQRKEKLSSKWKNNNPMKNPEIKLKVKLLNKGHNIRNTGRTHFKKGIVPWNKGIIGKDSHVYGRISAMKGKKHSLSTRLKISLAEKKRVLEGKHNNYRGGISSENSKIRSSIDMQLWRESVLSRNNFTCQKCNKRGINLVCHHIKNFSEFKDLRFAIDNGITFCKFCHNKFHLIYGRQHNNLEQLNEFISNNGTTRN